jgi:tripeptidyl-peptidase-1
VGIVHPTLNFNFIIETHPELFATMRSSSSFLCIALTLFATAQCVVVPKAHVVHEKRAVTPSRWVKRERLSPAVILPMRIGLKQKNLHRGYDLLMDVLVMHPFSPP